MKIASDKDGWLIPNPELYKSYEEMADAIVKESQKKPLNLRGCDDFEISMKRVGSQSRRTRSTAKTSPACVLVKNRLPRPLPPRSLLRGSSATTSTERGHSSLSRTAQPSAPFTCASTILTAASMG